MKDLIRDLRKEPDDFDAAHICHRAADALETQEETIQAMESVLAKIGEHLGVEPGDVAGLLAAVEDRQ